MKKFFYGFLLLFMIVLLFGCDEQPQELATPADLAITGNVVTWSEVAGASGYKILINETEHYTEETSYDFSDLATEDLTISVKAVSEDPKYLDSPYSEPVVFDFKIVLATPVISLDGNIVSWSAIENALKYRVRVNDEEYDVTELSFDISELADADLTIAVKALGDGKDYLDSPYSDEVEHKTATKLIAPKVSLSGTTVVWDEVANATGYVVKINGNEYQTETTLFDFSELAEEDLTISVKAKGDGSKFLDSDFSANVTYIVTYKLATPAVTVSDFVLSWTPVANAESYVVTIDGVDYPVSETTFDLSEIIEGTVGVTVRAIGDQERYFDSDESAPISLHYGIKIDGVLEESEWNKNHYVTKNTENSITQFTRTHFGRSHLYLSFEVTDGNVVSDKTHLEVFLTIGEDVGFDQSWQIRFYASGSIKTYVYNTPNEQNWAWKEQPVDLESAIVLTDSGYVVEAMIPYSALNISEAPTDIKLLSYLCFVIPGSSGVTVRDGNNQINNSYGIDINNYVTFDEKGYVPTEMFAENIVFGDGDLVDGFFVKEFHLYTNASKLLKINGANFDSPYFSEISEGLYRISIPEDEIETYTEAQEFVAFLGELSASFTVQYVEMTLDGVLDENEWSENIYVSKNTENDITQVIRSYIGRAGLYIGFDVTDGNVVSDKTHLEVFLNIGEELGIGNTWQFRFYASGTIRTFVYTTPNQDNWAWTEKTGANKLQVQAAIVLTETGYVVEALIPYTTLNLDAAPEEFDLLSLMCFVKAGQSSVNVYDGDTKSNNTHLITINNYVTFNEIGFVPTSIYAENIVLGDGDLVDGVFVKEFYIYADARKLNKIKGASIDGPYFTEIGDGLYRLSIPEEEIEDFVEANEFVVVLDEISASFTVQYVEMTLDGVLDEAEWSENSYLSKNNEHNVSQVIRSHIGRTGLYLGIEVTDGNVVSDRDMTHLEVFLNIGEELGLGNTWQFRFYASGTIKTYVYKTPDASYWAWTEKKDAEKLVVQAVIVLTETGYVVEALIPYTTLNLDAAPKEFDLLSYLCFVIPGNTSLTVRDGNNPINNQYSINIDNYVAFDEEGFVPGSIYAENIVLGVGDLVDGVFVKEFYLYTDANKLNKITGAEFNSSHFAEIGEGLYRISIPEDEIESFLEAQEFVAFLGDLSANFTVQYVEMTLDGTLDESEWSENSYVSKNTENDITQGIRTYLGRTGLYLGIEVVDGNVVTNDDKTHLEVFLNVGEELGIGNTWQFRFYASGTIRTFVYTTPNQDNWAWSEKKDSEKLAVQAAIVLTETGYVVEALIPYTTLNLDAAPEEFDLLSLMCFVKPGQDSVNAYDGDVKTNNAHVININNYVTFNENGFVPESIHAEDIVLSDENLVDGVFVKEFYLYADANKLNKIRGASIDSPYFTEIGDGLYRLSIPEEEIENFLEGQEFVALLGELAAPFTVRYGGIIVDGVLDEGLWNQNGYVYKAVEGSNVVTVETISHLTKDGIYLGFTVTDANTAIISNSPNVNHGSGIILYITDGPLNKTTSHMMRIFADGYYRCAEYEGTRWYGPKNDYYLDIEVATSLTADGYVIEVFLPFASLKMAENTEEVYIFSGAFVKRTDGTYAERYGLTNVFNNRNNNFDYYFKFDETGYVVERLFVDDMVLTEADLVDGNYVKTFVVTSDVDRMVRVEAEFDSEYITKNADGTYTLTVPASMVPSEIEVSVNGITTSFGIIVE